MPTYDYRCNENGQVVEVRHGMMDKVTTWGELCALAGMSPGETDPATPVERLANGGQVVRNTSLGDRGTPCQSGAPCCGAKACGLG